LEAFENGIKIQNRLKNKDFRAIKKKEVKILKTEYAVFVYYKLESKYKKSSKFEEVMVQNPKKMSDFKWNTSYIFCYNKPFS
jgi:hypothetical protein